MSAKSVFRINSFKFCPQCRFAVKSAFGLSTVMLESALQLFVVICLGFVSCGRQNVEITDEKQG